MSFLDMVTDRSLSLSLSLAVLAQVVQLHWSPKLDENQTWISGIIIVSQHHIILLSHLIKHVYPGLWLDLVCVHRIVRIIYKTTINLHFSRGFLPPVF